MSIDQSTREAEYGRAALAWMRAQARALEPSLEPDAGPLTCSRIIADAIASAPQNQERENASLIVDIQVSTSS